MFKINNCSHQIKYSILLYAIFIGIYIYIRPSLSFNLNGSLKEFGTTNDKEVTVFPLWVICVLLSIISYYVIIFICSIKKTT